jgi:hypothetical protein
MKREIYISLYENKPKKILHKGDYKNEKGIYILGS